MHKSFHYLENKLHCESINLIPFAEKRATPFYLYSQQELSKNCNAILNIGNSLDFLPCYALKANYNPHLLKIICNLGFGADVVSGGELYFALKAGFSPSKIVFAGVGKTAVEIELAIVNGIHSLNIESFEELKLVSQIAKRLKKSIQIAVRVNPDIEAETHNYISTGLHSTKFGVSSEEALKIYKLAQKDEYLRPAGLHVHIGSQIITSAPYLKTIKFLKELIKNIESLGIHLSFLDLGGGIGINYQNKFLNGKTNSTYINEILPAYLEGFRNNGLKLVVELGRSIIGSAGILITQVLYRKQTPQKKFLIVDAAMNNLIRPSLYGAHHEIVPLQVRAKSSEIYDVVGPVCESGDFLAKDRQIQKTKAGDYLAVVGAGAYGQALSSNYNLRPRIAEYLVEKDQAKTIFQGETIENIINTFNF